MVRVHCVTNNPAKQPARAKRRSVSIQAIGPCLFELLFGNEERQTILFPITSDARAFLVHALAQVSPATNFVIRLADGLIRIMDEQNNLSDSERMVKLRTLLRTYAPAGGK